MSITVIRESILCSRYSNYTTRWMVRGSNPSKSEEILSSPKRPDRLWGSPVFLSHGYQGSVSVVKRLVFDFNHSALSSTTIKNDRSYTSTPHIRLHDLVKLSHYRPGWAVGFQEVEVHRFQESRHMKVVSLQPN